MLLVVGKHFDVQATMKESLESGPGRMIRVCLLDAPEQDIPLGRGDLSEGSLAIIIVLSYSPWAQGHQETTQFLTSVQLLLAKTLRRLYGGTR